MEDISYIYKPKVSVIIPVYNTELYVSECIESICKQTLTEIEIIIINDGSTDNSFSILKQYENKDCRIKLFSQKNQGLSTTRNNGLSHALGKYIYFMDSDDIIDEYTLEECFILAEKDDLDFVFFNASTFYENNFDLKISLKYEHTDIRKAKVDSGINILQMQLLENKFTPSACLSFISHNFLKKHQLTFFPNILHEDQLFTILLYINAERASSINKAFFHRRLRNNSIMTNKFSWKNISSYMIVSDELIKFVKAKKSRKVQDVIYLHLSQMLDAAMWESYVLPLQQRVYLVSICLLKYFKFIRPRTLCGLVVKKYIK